MATPTPEEQLVEALKAHDLDALYEAVSRSPNISAAQLDFLAAFPSPFHDRALLAISQYLLPEQSAEIISPAVLQHVLQLESYEQRCAREVEDGLAQSAAEHGHNLEQAASALTDYISDLRNPAMDALRRSKPSTASEVIYRAHPSLPADDAHVAAAILVGKWTLTDLMLDRAEIQKRRLGDACFTAAISIDAITESGNARSLQHLLHHPQFEPNPILIAQALHEAKETLDAPEDTLPPHAQQRARTIDYYLRQYLLEQPELRKEIGDSLARPNLPGSAEARAFVEAVNDDEASVEHAAQLLADMLRKSYNEKKQPLDLHKLRERGKLQHGMTANVGAIISSLQACPPFDDAEKQERLLDILKETEVLLAHDGFRRHPLMEDYLQKHAIGLSPQRIISRTSWNEIER